MRTAMLTAEEKREHRNAYIREYNRTHREDRNVSMYKYYKKRVGETLNENIDYGAMWGRIKAYLGKTIREDESFLNTPYKEQCFILQNAKILREMERLEKSYGKSRD